MRPLTQFQTLTDSTWPITNATNQHFVLTAFEEIHLFLQQSPRNDQQPSTIPRATAYSLRRRQPLSGSIRCKQGAKELLVFDNFFSSPLPQVKTTVSADS
jgi:hypothetical protein